MQAKTVDEADSERLPPGQQLVAAGKWPFVGEKLPSQSTRPWELSIAGLVSQPRTFDLDQLRSMPQTKMVMDIHCVTRWSKFDVEFGGVMLSDLLEESIPRRWRWTRQSLNKR